MPEDLSATCLDAFSVRHGGEAERLARASGRVNLIGEHVDYLGGQCLPIALPYATWVACRLREDAEVHLSSSKEPAWSGRRGISLEDPATEGWARYVLAALDESEHLGGVDLHVESTVPVGAGLSSSAALICAVLRAVDDRANADLIAPAVRAETEGVGAPTGGMDQSIALLGQVGHALRLDFGGGRPVSIPWNPRQVGLELLVVDTGVTHDNDDGAFARVRRVSERAMSWEHNAGELSADEAAARRHVESENQRVAECVEALVRGDWRAVGDVLVRGHASLRDDLKVSSPELDAVVATALESGALGARMTGGGFGGSAIVLAPVESREAVLTGLRSVFERRGFGAPRVLIADAEGSATRIR